MWLAHLPLRRQAHDEAPTGWAIGLRVKWPLAGANWSFYEGAPQGLPLSEANPSGVGEAFRYSPKSSCSAFCRKAAQQGARHFQTAAARGEGLDAVSVLCFRGQGFEGREGSHWGSVLRLRGFPGCWNGAGLQVWSQELEELNPGRGCLPAQGACAKAPRQKLFRGRMLPKPSGSGEGFQLNLQETLELSRRRFGFGSSMGPAQNDHLERRHDDEQHDGPDEHAPHDDRGQRALDLAADAG